MKDTVFRRLAFIFAKVSHDQHAKKNIIVFNFHEDHDSDDNHDHDHEDHDHEDHELRKDLAGAGHSREFLV